jgi:hypothetical protein
MTSTRQASVADPGAPANPDPFGGFDVAPPPQAQPQPVPQPDPAPVANDNAPASAEATTGQAQDDPFAKFDVGPAPSSSSATGAFARGAVKGALPAAGTLAAAAGGAEVGAALGVPFAPVTAGWSVPIASFGLGLVGGFAGGAAVQSVQNWALSKVSDSWKDPIGLGDKQAQADEAQHSTASFLGGLSPGIVTMRPSGEWLKELPENYTRLQGLLAQPVTGRLFGGSIMGIAEARNEKSSEQNLDWPKIATATVFGTIFNRPNRIGEVISEAGAHPVRSVFGIPHPTPAPTLAQAADLKVMGPGITEPVFQGTQEQAPQAALTAQENARQEQAAIGEPLEPDLHAVARQMEPETFARYDDLLKRRDTLQAWMGEGEEQNAAAPHLAATEAEIRQLSPDIAAAYRRAADTVGTGTVEPEKFPSFAAMLAAHEHGPSPAAPAVPALDARLDAMEAEAGGLATEAYKGHENAKIPDEKLPLHSALQAASSVGWDVERAAKGAQWAVENGRPDIAQAIAERAERRAAEPVSQPGVPEGSPKYEAIKASLQTAKEQDGKDAQRLRKIAGEPGVPNGGEIPNSVNGAGAVENAGLPRPQRTISEQRAAIASDVERRLIAAGRPAEEAQAAGKLIAARYVTRAGRFEGKLGTPEELYAREGAAIAGPSGRAEAPARPPQPVEPPEKSIVNPIDPNAAPQEKVRQLEALTAQNKPVVDDFLKNMDADLGTESKSNAKAPENILSKASRPSILARKPWHDVEHIRDSFRFKTVLDDFAKVPDIVQRLTDAGFSIVKRDTGKVLKPMEWGWRILSLDLRAPNGQLLEYYLPVKELEQAKKDVGHKIFEKWRNKAIADLSPEEEREYEADRARSNEIYQKAWDQFLARSGASESDVRAALSKVSTSEESLTGSKSSATSPNVNDAGFQTPPTRSAENLPPASEGRENTNTVEGSERSEYAPAIEDNIGSHAEPVNAALDIADKIDSLSPAEQKRELPAYSPATDATLAPKGPDQPAGVFMFDPTQLNVDASRFQFKSGGDEYGVTGALRNVTKWDPAKAQSIIVWEANDGKLYVADGHQRAGLARRLTEQGSAKDIQLPGVLYREKDGISAGDIKAIAAVTNIANGSGSALDGAKVLRARPDLMDGSLPLSVGKGKQAAALARLGDEPFRMVVNDVVPEHYGAVVGELIPNDPARQAAAMKAIARFEPKNADEAAVLTQRVAQAELAKAEEGKQTSMFGDLETPESTAGEEMKIVGRAIAELKKDKALFSRVLANAERIEQTGSHIAREQAQGVASDAELFAKTLTSDAYTKGPLRTELVKAARDLKNGKSTVGDATGRILDALRREAEAHGADRAGAVEREPEAPSLELAQTSDANDLFEPGAEGKPQQLIPGVKPVTQRDLVQAAANKPLTAKKPQKAAGGLFGDSMDQKELFQAAYHGSPYDFDMFDTGKIGTGEGAQAYGHGLYFAENEGVAKSYRDALTRDSDRVLENGGRLPPWVASTMESKNPIAVEDLRKTFQGRIAEAEQEAKTSPQPWLYPGKIAGLKDVLKSIEDHAGGVPLKPAGTLYRVNIKPEPHEFLQWDKPLSEQSEKVKKIIGDLGVKGEKPIAYGEFKTEFLNPMHDAIQGKEFAKFLKPDDFYTGNVNMDAVRQSLADDPATLAKIEELQKSFHARNELRGSDIYHILARAHESEIGGLTGAPRTREAAEALKEAGIPGIRYLDAGSRSAGEGSHNYVVFDPKDIEILDKNGKAVTRQQFELEQAAQGGIKLNPNNAPGRDYLGVENINPILRLFKQANASTIIHESGHQFLAELMRDAAHPDAPADLKADAKTALDWLGVEKPEDIATKHHEKFARGFEQYLREGTAPSKELAGVFAKFRNWLLSIYQSIKGLGTEISPDIRHVFDRLLEMEPQRTIITPHERPPGGPLLHEIHAADAVHTEPHEAAAVFDRTRAELDRYVAEPPPDIAHEITTEVQKVETDIAARAGSTAGTDAGTEAGAGPGGSGQVVQGGGKPGSVPQSGGVGQGRGDLGGSAGQPAAESDGVQRPDNRAKLGDSPGTALAPGPADLFGARESGLVDKAGNIRLDTLTSDENVAQAIRESAASNNDFIGDRRGVITDGQVLELADALGMDAQTLSQRQLGQAFNAEQIVAARKLLIQSAADVSMAMRKAATGTDEDVMAYAAAKARHQGIQAQVAGITAEAGRALRAFRDITGEGKQATEIGQFLKDKAGKTLFQLRAEAKLGAELQTPQQVSKFMHDSTKHNFSRIVLEYWINGLISGPATHLTYMAGNTISAIMKVPEAYASAAAGHIAAQLGREGTGVHVGEAGALIRGAARGFAPAVKAGIDALRTGVTTALPSEGPNQTSLPFQPGSELAQPAHLDEAATFHDAMSAAYGLVQGMKDTVISHAALVAAGGVPGESLIGREFVPGRATPNITYRGVTVLPTGALATLPGRGVAVIHSFFRSLVFSMEKNAMAYRQAANEGLSGNELHARVAQLRTDPSQSAMDEAAAHEATEAALMGKGSELTQRLSALTNTPIFGSPLLKFIDPFVRVSGNIIDQSLIRRTPAGLLTLFGPETELARDLTGKNGNVAQDKAIGRMMVGTALAVTFGSLAAQKMLSGSGPKDPKEAAIWRMAGNQAHSVRIGDTWYQVNKLGPVGMLASISADLYDVAHEAEQGDLTSAGAHLLHAITQNVLDESAMHGPAELLKAIESPDRYGESYVRNYLAAFVPYSVGLSQIARGADPYQRDTRTMIDTIRNKIPGHLDSWFGNELPVRRDIWGEALPSRSALGGAGVSAIYEQQINSDPVNQAMYKLGVFPGAVQRKIRNAELTPEQYDDYQRIAGRSAKMRLDKIVISPQFQHQTPSQQHDWMVETIKQSRSMATEMMLHKYPVIAAEATQAKALKKQAINERNVE